MREKAQLQPYEGLDYLTEEDVDDLRTVTGRIIQDFEDKKLGYTEEAYKTLLDIGDKEKLNEYQDLKIEEESNTGNNVTPINGRECYYFKAKITYSKKGKNGDENLTVNNKYIAFDAAESTYYITEENDDGKFEFNKAKKIN